MARQAHSFVIFPLHKSNRRDDDELYCYRPEFMDLIHLKLVILLIGFQLYMLNFSSVSDISVNLVDICLSIRIVTC